MRRRARVVRGRLRRQPTPPFALVRTDNDETYRLHCLAFGCGLTIDLNSDSLDEVLDAAREIRRTHRAAHRDHERTTRR